MERCITTEERYPDRQFWKTAWGFSRRLPHFDVQGRDTFAGTHAGSTISHAIRSGGNGPPDSRPHLIDFVSCSYLGLDNHPLIVAAAIEAAEGHRSWPWSRSRTRVSFDLLGELEYALSEMFCARVLAFSSGMLANVGSIPILASGRLTGGSKPVVVFDRFAHNSLLHQRPLIAEETRVETIAHNDIDDLERLCRENSLVAYVCNGVYPIGGDAPTKELHQLQERYGLFLYMDDALGLSIFGPHGEGFARSNYPQWLGERTIIAASLAKGFGAAGGMLMLGTAEHEATFRCSIPYAFSGAPNPAAIGAALASCKIHRSAELKQRLATLSQRIDLFDRRLATAQQGNSLPIRMIAIGSEASAIETARGLFDMGFYTSVTPLSADGVGKVGIRVCITAEHAVRDIERLCDGILEKIADTTGKPYPLR
ncbi:aminotransferase class I/II-fold pyridoxal phosphate-dependent enzyme [Bradyrhizobium sp. NDS-1]|uniref:aminotransferase class I/II-fold pyridoxal phosphate-dependent enzyme n=2 Tax=Bradyrhizobium TaxID=374 RepID=UPI00293E7E91|nr:aminotransferase class I/II-fold pyridoxal phosphate-dependent enzyme [Bradyrhizobium sp. NDS-1]WOH75664.1 aminotransferase class I/II-fold pyridoxal phosphate-dependent enzyme [Bradyrhizobium sp. NDS-1]